jgi:hypothetical protein
MNLPPIYTAFCVLILGSFVYLKYQGQELIGSSAADSRGTGGSHYSGVYVGSHK